MDDLVPSSARSWERIRFSVEDESDLAPDEFFPFYEEYSKANPFSQPDIRRINPYTGKLIRTQADYDEYLREHAYHILRDQKAREELALQKKSSEQQLLQTRSRYRKIIAVLLLLLAAAVAAALFLSGRYSQGVSDGERSGYQSGYSEGYSAGEQAGYSSGFQSNTEHTGSVERSGSGSSTGTGTSRDDPIADTYIGNKNSHKFHLPTCSWLPDTKNQVTFDSREDAISAGYVPCKRCNP